MLTIPECRSESDLKAILDVFDCAISLSCAAQTVVTADALPLEAELGVDHDDYEGVVRLRIRGMGINGADIELSGQETFDALIVVLLRIRHHEETTRIFERAAALKSEGVAV